MQTLTNWSGNYTFAAARLHRPETIAELQSMVRRSRKVRVIGARHSFNAIADSPEELISLDALVAEPVIDNLHATVTVAASMRYGPLAQYLHAAGYALPNLASLPHISVAGACSTATHGSGDANGNLSTAVSALELVTAEGELMVLSRAQHGAQFDGMVVALGGLGVVTRLTLEIVTSFDVCQSVYEQLPLASLLDHFEEIESSAYSVSLFTDWQSDYISQVWLKRLAPAHAALGAAPELFGATLATGPRHPLSTMPSENCTQQMGVPGPWHERLTHFRMEFTPSAGEELQTEYFVPRAQAADAFRAVSRLRASLLPVLYISEVRTIAADRLWLSMCYARDSVAIHFTWRKDWEGVRAVLPRLEAALEPYHARPHWGKLFTMQPAHLQSLYPKLPDFRQLLSAHDPQAKFRNAFLDSYIFG